MFPQDGDVFNGSHWDAEIYSILSVIFTCVDFPTEGITLITKKVIAN